ncbi:hypothetical protein ZWY2020_014296 [Hordeum vulgare]|nr:hypothetical protein ZWY2020_014296 [Hordeum vulgare]
MAPTRRTCRCRCRASPCLAHLCYRASEPVSPQAGLPSNSPRLQVPVMFTVDSTPASFSSRSSRTSHSGCVAAAHCLHCLEPPGWLAAPQQLLFPHPAGSPLHTCLAIAEPPVSRHC